MSSDQRRTDSDCQILPPGFERAIAKGTPCPLPRGHGDEHETTTPDGQTWVDCAYPDDCRYDDDADCCVSYGPIRAAGETP